MRIIYLIIGLIFFVYGLYDSHNKYTLLEILSWFVQSVIGWPILVILLLILSGKGKISHKFYENLKWLNKNNLG